MVNYFAVTLANFRITSLNPKLITVMIKELQINSKLEIIGLLKK